MGVWKAVHWAVNVFVRIGFQVMISVIPHPGDGITRKHHGGPGCQYKLEPFRHFKAAVGQIAMQIKCGADSAPEKERKHDRQIGNVEASQKSDHSEQLQGDQDDEDEKI